MLTAQDKKKIRLRETEGYSHAALARRFGVSRSHISRICRSGRSYSTAGFTQIPGFPGYWINRDGEVRSQNIRGVPSKNKWYKMSPILDTRNRYGFHLKKDGKSYWVRRAPLLLLTFVGPCPPGMECCHTNDVSTDDRLDNLRWDTHANNMRDMVRNRRPEEEGQA